MTDDEDEIKREISKRVAAFDPIALLDLLAHMGYEPEEVLFESNQSVTSQPSLIHSVEFHTQPVRQVVVSLNMGLLSSQTPLPTYWRSILEDADVDEQALVEFLRFFDHRLLAGYMASVYPERDPLVIKDWAHTKQSYLELLGIRSLSTLHWVFQHCFPELEVEVGRGTLKRNVKLEGAELGKAILGDPGTVLGGWTKAPVPGFVATLYCEEEHTDFGRPWAEEVRRRLDALVFPAIAAAAIDLKVMLVIRSEKVWAQLRPGSYLGFDRIKGGARRNREVRVFQGNVTPDTSAIDGVAVFRKRPRAAPRAAAGAIA